MGAVADIVNMGDWSRMRMWALAAGVAILGFNTMVALGWVEAGKSIYAAPRLLWLSHVLGGLLFGVGMVLASGCGSKTLVRVGGGSLKAVVVFVVLGVSAYMTMRGLFGVWRVASVDAVALTLPTGQDLPSLLARASGIGRPMMAHLLSVVIGGGLIVWVLLRPEGQRAEVLLAGAAVGAVIVAVWWVSGRLGHLAEHPQTLEEAFLATEQRPHGVAHLRRARGLHAGLAHALQRQEQGAHGGHRHHGGRDRRLRRRGAGHAHLPLGRASAAPRTRPITSSVRC
jgi:uncharacterized membrane protein YedE/YeeE